MNIILFGPPGVGKGTQGTRLSEDYGFLPIAMGDLLRSEVKEGSDLGLKAKTYMDVGALVPDAVVIGMIESRIVADDAAKGFVLDGFPRNVVQAEALVDMLAKHAVLIDRVVFMQANKAVLVERLSGRLICSACGFGFHRHHSPPEKEGCCDRCGGTLYQRDDDCEDVIESRLKVYVTQTAPLLDYYSGSDLFRSVDAEGDLDDIYSRLQQALGEIN
ncbi:MAG: adenylate kinase [Mariprofundaceae bacterium]|nr:adenylate kinase [Mariprofundaceae bacterium]